MRRRIAPISPGPPHEGRFLCVGTAFGETRQRDRASARRFNIGDRPVDLSSEGPCCPGGGLAPWIADTLWLGRGDWSGRRSICPARRTYGYWHRQYPSAPAVPRGNTLIRGAAREPEIVRSGPFPYRAGRNLMEPGTSTIEVAGVEQLLGGANHRVIADRIEAATLLLAAAISGGEAVVTGVVADHLTAVLDKLADIGADRICRRSHFSAGRAAATTGRYRGRALSGHSHRFAGPMDGPDDAGQRTQHCRRQRFSQPLQHVAELNRIGPRIECARGVATIDGAGQLCGARVTASDLRASAALVLAGLAAKGETMVHRVGHLDRGYERLDLKLRGLGARMCRHNLQDHP